MGAVTALCGSSADQTLPINAASFTYEVAEALEVAGNPMAYLTLSTDRAGGVVGVG